MICIEMICIEMNQTTIGLLLDIAGIAILMVFGVPTAQDVSKDGTGNYRPKPSCGEKAINESIRKYKRNLFLTRLAYALILIGFLLQIVKYS